MDAMIKTQDLTRAFGDLTAVERLTLEVGQGEIFGLVGPDGAGKTTTLRMLSGILDASSGRAEVAGLDLVQNPDAVKEVIGYMPQRFGLYEDLTVEENIRFYADIFSVPRKVYVPRMEELLAFSRLAPFRTRLARNLSGGMKQKLGLTCALIHTPRLLLLDEPTNGVDPVSRRDFWTILYQLLREGITILIATSYLDEAERCHRVGLMYQGRLIKLSRPADLRQNAGRVLEVNASDNRRAQQVLADLPGLMDYNLYGGKWHLSMKDPETGVKELAGRLSAAGLELLESREITPSLEDIFIALIHRQEAS